MAEQRETYYNYIAGNDFATIGSSEQKWINKIKRAQEQNSDKVHIIAENPDGSIVAHCPPNWFKWSPPKKMSEEQKQAARERMKAMWADKESNN